MAFQAKVLSFAKSTAATPPNVDQAVTGAGFTPKAIILWATLNTTEDAFIAGYTFAWGITDGSTSFSVCGANQDGGADNAQRRHANKALTIMDYTLTVLAECDLKSLDADGFTLTWTTNNASAYRIHALCLGGAELSAKVATWVAPTSTGNQSVTGVGFTADTLFFLGDEDDTAPAANDNGSQIVWGFAANRSDFKNGGLSGYSEDGGGDARSELHAVTSPARCWIARYWKDPADVLNGSFIMSSWDSDGFTVNWDKAPGNAYYVAYLALKGVKAYIRNRNSPTSTGNEAITEPGFTPVALFTASHSSSGQLVNNNLPSIGAATSGADGAAWAGDQLNSGADQRSSNTKSIIMATAGAEVLRCEASLVSFDPSGFTLNWSTVYTSALGWLYVALTGETAAPTAPLAGPSLAGVSPSVV